MKKKDKFPLLKITNIKWNSSSNNLPLSIELQWTCKDWNFYEVTQWLSEKYNSTINNLSIEQIGLKKSSG